LTITIHSSEESKYLPIPLNTLAGQDLAELEAKAAAAAEAMRKEQEALMIPGKDADVNAEGINKAEEAKDGKTEEKETDKPSSNDDKPEHRPAGTPSADLKGSSADVTKKDDDGKGKEGEDGKNGDKDSLTILDSEDVVFLGLRVYTNREAPAVVNGQLRHEMATSFAGLAIDE
jgi:hypothetical protein